MYQLTGDDPINISNNNTSNNNISDENGKYNQQIELDDFNNSYNDDNNNNNNNNDINNSFMSYKSTESIKPDWAVELLEEVKLLKEFLMSPKKENYSDNNENNNDNNNSDKKEINKPTLDELISIVRTSITNIITKSKEDFMVFESFKVGISTLIMYFQKILDNPQIPRYRRIHKSNQNFMTLVEPLKGYDSVMVSVGFKDVGNSLEYYPSNNTNTSSNNTPNTSPIKNTINDDDADDDDAENKKILLTFSIECLRSIINSEGYDEALQKVSVELNNNTASQNTIASPDNKSTTWSEVSTPFPQIQSNSNFNVLNFDDISSKAKATIQKSSESINISINHGNNEKDDIIVKELSPIRR
jgi:hypothetical protein